MKRRRKHSIGLELVAGAHHADGQQQRHVVLLSMRAHREIGTDIDEGRQPDLACARPQARADAPDVAWIDGDYEVGGGQRTLGRAMAETCRANGALRRVRGLGDHIGNAERPGDDRPQPVGFAVVAVIGEPQIEALGMMRRQRPPARNQARCLFARAPFEREVLFGFGHALGHAAARRHDNLVVEAREQPRKPARHFAVARRYRMIGRLEGRVQQHTHG